MPRPSSESTGRKTAEPSPTPPVARAVVLPPLDIPARPHADSDAEIAPELERDLLPVTGSVASGIADAAAPFGLELSEVGPSESSGRTDVPPPPPAFDQPETIPSSAARAFPVGASVTPGPVAATPTHSEHRSHALLPKVTLWVLTATVPAAAVWMLMRYPKSMDKGAMVPAATSQMEYRAQTARPNDPPPLPAPVEPSSAPPASTDTIDPPRASADPSPAPSSTSAESITPSATVSATSDPAPASSIPIAVETDASDRVAILVRTRPEGAKVLRRGKEIGRTPLTIEIGRGEHRIFEVSMVGFGAKRIILDGGKPEIMVNMAVEAKPQTIYVPAPLPEKKYERLE